MSKYIMAMDAGTTSNRQATDASFSIKRGKCAASPKENSPNIFLIPDG